MTDIIFVPDVYMKTSSNSLTVFLGELSSTSTLNKNHMIEQPFLLLSFSPIPHLAFSIQEILQNSRMTTRYLEVEYLRSSSSSFDNIFSFDTIDAFDFSFIKAINDGVFTLGNMYRMQARRHEFFRLTTDLT